MVGVVLAKAACLNPVHQLLSPVAHVHLQARVRLKLRRQRLLGHHHLLLERVAPLPVRRAVAVHFNNRDPGHTQAEGVAEGAPARGLERVAHRPRVFVVGQGGLALAEDFGCLLSDANLRRERGG